MSGADARRLALRSYVELLLRRESLLDAGGDGNALDNLMDGPWDAMTEAECDLCHLLRSALDRARIGRRA